MSRGLRYLLGLTPSGVLNLPSIDTYLSYFQGMILGFGLAFELPLALVILNVAHILTHERFRRWRRLMLFGAFLFAGHREPEPGPAQHAAAGRALRGPGRGGRDRHLLQRPPPGPHPDPYAGLADDQAAPLEMDDDPRAASGDRSPH